ncbi:MAG TPA: DNA-processing protein DprA [Candidatus Dormibacteraeota bacterium]|nr:DNA-processing protein DprA [Candidatus Dormibacteraeota bacterium]
MSAAPPLPQLRTRGRWPPPPGPRAAIVGSRRPSPYGEAVAEQLGSELAAAGVVIVSGLALGVDAAAHRGALHGGGTTVAVMGTGVDVVYPPSHAGLADEIVAGGGALVSQFPDGALPRRHNFPARNYTMAAISDVVVVVEAAQGSGALITAEAAVELGKDVLAVPGSIFSPLSVGTHGLISDGAGLVQNARDVLAALRVEREVLDDPLAPPASAGFELARAGDGLVLHLSETMALSASELARKVQLPVAEVVGRLTSLELQGAVRRHGSGYLRALRRGKTRA